MMPGLAQSLSPPAMPQCVTWGSISAKRTLVPKTRQGVVDLDISREESSRPGEWHGFVPLAGQQFLRTALSGADAGG